MAYIKNYSGVFEGSTLDNKTDFFSGVGRLFEFSIYDHDNETNKKWEEEFSNIVSFFEGFPEEFHEEFFFKICNSFLINRATRVVSNYSYPTQFSDIHKAFLSFLNDPLFQKFLPLLSQNIDQNSIFLIVQNSLVSDNINIAKQYTELFLTSDTRHVRFLDTCLGLLVKANNKTAIHFLLDHYNGWNNKTVLKSLTSMSLDDNLLDKLIKNIGKFNNNNIDSLANILELNIPVSRKNDIIEKYSDYTNFNKNIFSFYITNISNGELNIDELINKGSQFIELLKSPIYLNSAMLASPKFFMTAIPTLIKLDIVSSDILEKTVIDFWSSLSSKEHTLDGYFPQLLELNKTFNKNWNDPKWQIILIRLAIEEPFNFNSNHLINNPILNLTLPLEISPEQPYSSLKDFLEKTDNFIYRFIQLQAEQNPANKKNLYLNIVNTLHDEKISKNIVNPGTFFYSPIFKDFFQYALKIDGAKSFFDKWFIKDSFEHGFFNDIFRENLFELYQGNKIEPIVFNLPEEHPLFNFMDNHVTSNSSENTFSYQNTQFLMNLSKLFNNSIGYIERDGVSFFQYCLNTKLVTGDYLSAMMHNSKRLKKKSFFNLGTEEIPLQIQLNEHRNVSIIIDPTKVISKNNQELTSELTSDELNNFDDLMSQAKQNVVVLNQTLNKYNDKNLSIEVKIRADNLLLNNITFLERIKGGIEAINFEDTYFLKNTIGKYLIQCIESYAKSITRYEILLNPANKNFSKQSEEDMEAYKDKLDNEALKQLQLLEKQLELVKEHIINQFNNDLLTDMRVKTRILEAHVENTVQNTNPTNHLLDQEEHRVVNIKQKA